MIGRTIGRAVVYRVVSAALPAPRRLAALAAALVATALAVVLVAVSVWLLPLAVLIAFGAVGSLIDGTRR